MNVDKFKENKSVFAGRLNRKAYIIRVSIVYAVSLTLSFLILSIIGPHTMGALKIILSIILSFVLFGFHSRRLHDLGKSGWVSLLFLVPVLNVGLIIYMLFYKGNEFTNEYGPNPLDK